jgi:hypothetical protein
MTDAEHHQQEMEQQEQEDSVWERARLMAQNHGKMIGCAQTIRDSNGDEDYVTIAVKFLLEALKEHEDIKRRYG